MLTRDAAFVLARTPHDAIRDIRTHHYGDMSRPADIYQRRIAIARCGSNAHQPLMMLFRTALRAVSAM